jgi:antitoxin HicB
MKTKDLSYYLSLPYTIELIPDEEGYWFARIPLLEGCMTNGDSRENALIMLDDARQLWLETALSLGKTIPEPEAIPHESPSFSQFLCAP